MTSLDGSERRTKLRLTVHSAKNLIKKDFFRLPEPFAKIVVDGSGQCHSTDIIKSTLDPKWNQHYDLFLSRSDSVTVSVWNHRKVHRKEGAGFLGCVRLTPTTITRLRDTGYQRLNLTRNSPDDEDSIRGQLILSLTSRDHSISNPPALAPSGDELPEGWECRRTPHGREYYINHYTRTTQWERPTRPGYESVQSPRNSTPHTTSTSLPPSSSPTPRAGDLPAARSSASLSRVAAISRGSPTQEQLTNSTSLNTLPTVPTVPTLTESSGSSSVDRKSVV